MNKSGKRVLLCWVAFYALLVAANFAIGDFYIAIPGTIAGVILPLIALRMTKVI